MAIKPIIKEKCESCGVKLAELKGEAVWDIPHSDNGCERKVPGPSEYPRRFMLKDVIWKPSETSEL